MRGGETEAGTHGAEFVDVWWQHLGRTAQGRASRSVDSDVFLSSILTSYVGHEPAICRDGFGKPRLPAGVDDTLSFSLSHSGSWIAGAVTRNADLGFDLERLRSVSDVDAFIERCCTAREAELVRLYPRRTRTRALLEVWTIKEAYLKALGTGIRCRLTEVETRLAARGLGWQVSSALQPSLSWHAQRLSAPHGYLAALCCSVPDRPVRHYRRA